MPRDDGRFEHRGIDREVRTYYRYQCECDEDGESHDDEAGGDHDPIGTVDLPLRR